MIANIVQLDPTWKALADPTRRALLDLLRDRPRTTGELSSAFDTELSRFAVIKHIGVLESAGLVVSRRRGRNVWHYLNAVPLQQMYERWVKPYEAYWASSLIQLQRHVEASSQSTEVKMQGFKIDQEVRIAAPPSTVYRALTDEVDTWWAMRSDNGSVHLEARAGGRFYESADGGETLWATVTRVQPDDTLELSGQMGMADPVLNMITYALSPEDGGTRLALSHRAVGTVSEALREDYVHGWDMLLSESLKAHVEAGTRDRA